MPARLTGFDRDIAYKACQNVMNAFVDHCENSDHPTTPIQLFCALFDRGARISAMKEIGGFSDHSEYEVETEKISDASVYGDLIEIIREETTGLTIQGVREVINHFCLPNTLNPRHLPDRFYNMVQRDSAIIFALGILVQKDHLQTQDRTVSVMSPGDVDTIFEKVQDGLPTKIREGLLRQALRDQSDLLDRELTEADINQIAQKVAASFVGSSIETTEKVEVDTSSPGPADRPSFGIA